MATLREADGPSPDEPAAKRQKLEAPESETDLEIFDEMGDLRLRVGASVADTETATFLVCSRALARASPVFKKMLFGGFAESRPTDGSDWIVNLPEDDPAQLRQILHIIHNNFNEVLPPTSFGLFNRTLGAHKYDCIGLFRPWASSWLERLSTINHRNANMLYVAWEFGDTILLRRLLAKVAYGAGVPEDSDGELTYSFSERDDKRKYRLRDVRLSEKLEGLIPDDIIDQVRSLRQEMIKAELQPFVDLYDSLKTNRRCTLDDDLLPSDQTGCNMMLFGSLVHGFLEVPIDIANRATAEQYVGSAKILRQMLGKVKLRVGKDEGGCQHMECQQRLNTDKSNAIKSVERLLTGETINLSEYQDHLDRQVKKTGIAPK